MGRARPAPATPRRSTLPERTFHNQIAKTLIEMRKGLSLHPDDHVDALAALDGLMQKPELFGGDAGAFLNLSAIYYLMVRDKDPGDGARGAGPDVGPRAAYGGGPDRAESARELEDARQAVRDAMDKRRTSRPTPTARPWSRS